MSLQMFNLKETHQAGKPPRHRSLYEMSIPAIIKKLHSFTTMNSKKSQINRNPSQVLQHCIQAGWLDML